MKIPKSNQYKRIYNILWIFYAFFILTVATIALISIDEMNKMTLISENYKTMSRVSFIADDILQSPTNTNFVKEKIQSLFTEVEQLDLLYLEENQKLNLSIRSDIQNMEVSTSDTVNQSITERIIESATNIKENSRHFIQNILDKEHKQLNQTQKIVLTLVILSMIVLTLVLVFIILPAVRKLDKLAIKIARVSKEREESLRELEERNKEIYFREKRFATISELSPIGLFLTDSNGMCQFVNKRYTEIVGMEYDDCMGEGWKEGIYEGDRERIFQSWYDSVKKNDEYYINEYRVQANNEFKNIAVKAKPIKDSNKVITGFVGMIEDITIAKEQQFDLQSTAKRFEQLVDDLPYGAVLSNEDGLYFNKAVEKIIGYSNKEINNIDDWFQKLYSDEAEKVKEIYNENKNKDFENEVIVDLITKSGAIKKVAFRDKLTSIGEIWGLEDKTDLINAELEKSEINEEYKFILDSIKVGVWDWTINSNTLVWNDLMYELYGIDRKNKVESYEDYKNRLHPDDVDRINKEIANVLKTPSVEFDTEFRVIWENGEIRYIRAVSKTYRDSENYAIRMVGLNLDITDKKRNEEIRRELAEKYELILNSTKIGVWDWDIKTNKISWNDTMYLLFDLPKGSDNVFEQFEKIVHPDDKIRTDKNLSKILSGEIEEYESEFRIILSDTNTKYIKAITKIEKDSDNNVSRVYGINLDISELKKSNIELKEAKENAELANKAKSTFLANMSHEIRTPMNAILGFSEILQNNNKDERNIDYISGIIKSGNSLLSLINDILDFSKIEANKMTLNLASVDINRVISDIDKIFEYSTSKKGIEYFSVVDKSIPPYLILDEGKLKQILINLIGNAVKFTDKGFVNFNLSFSFNATDTSKIQLKLTIKDSGIGISPKKIDSIFQPFEQEDANDSRKYEGTGLGLSIVKSIVDLHNGSIEVQSEIGVGSTFEVILPDISISLMRPNIVSISRKTEFEKYDLKDKTVLFAEDIESNRAVVKGFLEDYSVKVLFAVNGEDALEIARQNKIDLAFIDLHMPIMDGMTMAEIWTNDDKLKNIPLVALTAEVYDEEKQIDKDYFKQYLTKPVRAEEIYEAILEETGMKESKINEYVEKFDSELLNKDAIEILNRHEVLDQIGKLQKKLNTRELGKIIEKIEFLAEMENNDSLRNFVIELKLALDTFNVLKIKQLLASLSNNI